MSPVRPDPDLTLPGPLDPVPDLEVSDPELALAAQAGEGRLLLEGERGSVRVRERGAVEALHLDGRRVAANLTVEAGVVVNLVASPAVLRRERVAAGAGLRDVLLLPPRLPLLALQLRRSGPQGRPAAPPLHGTLTLLPDATFLRWRAEAGRLVAVDEARPDQRVILALAGCPGEGGAQGAPRGELGVDPDEDGGLRVRFTLPAGRGGTLVVAAGPAGSDLLAPAPYLAGHARMATASPAEGVGVATGVAEMDSAVDWARARLASAARRTPPTRRPWGLFWSGLGALAAGDEAAAARCLEGLEAWAPGGPEPGGTPHPLALPATPLPLLLAARYALALGDADPALRLAGRLDVGALEGGPVEPEAALLWALALESLADGIRWSAGEDEAARWRRLGSEMAARAGSGGASRAGTSSGTGSVRLPMVGGEEARALRPGGAAATLHRLLGTRGTASGKAPGPLAAWCAFQEGRVLEGWTLWRTALARGLEGGPEGRGSWDAWREGPGAPETGVVLATLVHGLLGWSPDAPVGRARLAPRLPGHLTRFSAQGLRVGGAALGMTYEKDGGLHRFVLEPTAGRAPATVVFEPLLPVDGVGQVRLDGEVVELDPRKVPGGTVAPVQLPVDGRRTVEITAQSSSI